MLSCGITVSAQTSSVNLIGTSLKGFDTATWTATAANSIIDGKIICAPNAGTNTAETVSTYTLGKYFKLEFYASVITYTNYYGEQLGIYSSVACIRPTVFSMTYIDGVATAYIDGEAVITAEVADVATESNIVYTHNQMYRNCILKDVKLYNYN